MSFDEASEGSLQASPVHGASTSNYKSSSAQDWSHDSNADEAMKAFQGLHGERVVLDIETNRHLLRKID